LGRQKRNFKRLKDIHKRICASIIDIEIEVCQKKRLQPTCEFKITLIPKQVRNKDHSGEEIVAVQRKSEQTIKSYRYDTLVCFDYLCSKS
jgi:hypothetical protein